MLILFLALGGVAAALLVWLAVAVRGQRRNARADPPVAFTTGDIEPALDAIDRKLAELTGAGNRPAGVVIFWATPVDNTSYDAVGQLWYELSPDGELERAAIELNYDTLRAGETRFAEAGVELPHGWTIEGDGSDTFVLIRLPTTAPVRVQLEFVVGALTALEGLPPDLDWYLHSSR